MYILRDTISLTTFTLRMSSETEDAILTLIHKVKHGVLVLHVFDKTAPYISQKAKTCTVYSPHLFIRTANQANIRLNDMLIRFRTKLVRDISTKLWN